MPLFYFSIDDEAPDEIGRELASVAQAKCEAVRYAGELICDSANTFWNSGEFRMIVSDDNGLALFSLHLIGADAPAIRPSA